MDKDIDKRYKKGYITGGIPMSHGPAFLVWPGCLQVGCGSPFINSEAAFSVFASQSL
jgi:hypothetical protein